MAVHAYTTTYPENVQQLIFAQIGLQSQDSNLFLKHKVLIKDSFSLQNGPIHFDRAIFQDTSHYENYVFMAYWDNPETYKAWLENAEVQEWWAGNQLDSDDKVGMFIEVATIPMTHFETIHSTKNNDSGVTHFLPLEQTKTHAFWGSMRKRMQASETDKLEPTHTAPLAEQVKKETFGKHLKVSAPSNICLIRTAQDWTHCNDEEKDTYLNLVEPSLQKAYSFLQKNPEETGAITPKFLYEVNENGEKLEKTCVVSFFLSMQHLEKWTHEHPTHIALFGTFAEMLKRHNFTVDLSLWHEVSVLQTEEVSLEYINCHPKTGFLPYFEVKEVALI